MQVTNEREPVEAFIKKNSNNNTDFFLRLPPDGVVKRHANGMQARFLGVYRATIRGPK